MTDIVHVENLVKRYDDLIALDHFNLSIAPGEIFGLLGPNGSGKTTSINCILQLLAYDKGTIELFGEPMTPARYDLKPELIFFDEPTVAVDPQSRNAILEGICRLRDEGATVVYTSHYMEEVEQICSRIMIMDGGRVLAQGTNDELKRMIQHVGLGRSLSHRAFHDVHVYVCESELRRHGRPGAGCRHSGRGLGRLDL